MSDNAAKRVFQKAEYIHRRLELVPLSKVKDPCPICFEDYNLNHVPVRLPECQHIFGRDCIIQWFQTSNTCPMDRRVLFGLNMSANQEIYNSQSLVTRRPLVNIIQGGIVLAVNSHLTRDGCRRVIADLWFYTSLLARRMSLIEWIELWSHNSVLRRPVRDAVPSAIGLPEQAWSALLGIARAMTFRHQILSPEVEAIGVGDYVMYVNTLERACRVDEND
jgi:hypothetical protein